MFGGTCFRDIYSGVNGKWYKKSWKEFEFFVQIIMMSVPINMALNAQHRKNFGKIKVGLMK